MGPAFLGKINDPMCNIWLADIMKPYKFSFKLYPLFDFIFWVKLAMNMSWGGGALFKWLLEAAHTYSHSCVFTFRWMCCFQKWIHTSDYMCVLEVTGGRLGGVYAKGNANALSLPPPATNICSQPHMLTSKFKENLFDFPPVHAHPYLKPVSTLHGWGKLYKDIKENVYSNRILNLMIFPKFAYLRLAIQAIPLVPVVTFCFLNRTHFCFGPKQYNYRYFRTTNWSLTLDTNGTAAVF